VNKLLSAQLQASLSKLYGLVASAIFLVVLIASILSWYSYQQANNQVVSETHNLANSLVLTFDGMVDTVDMALLGSCDEMKRQIASGKPNKAQIDGVLRELRHRVPFLLSLRATDESGHLIYGLDENDPITSVADRPYYSEVLLHPEIGLYVSRPIISRLKNQWIWLFSRRITKADGSFGGIVSASIPTDKINDLLSNVSMPPQSSISLRHKSMDLIARANFNRGNVIPIGSNKLSNTLSEALKQDPNQGTYISDTSGLDLVIKTYSYVASPKYGFYVIAGIPREFALAAWKRQVIVAAFLVCLFSAGAAIFTYLLRSAMLRQAEFTKDIGTSRDALQTLNAELEQRVQTRTEELTKTLENLQITQNDLIQSEKLASLGLVVVGISHEINTPIGNAITLTSMLIHHLQELRVMIERGSVSKGAIREWLDFGDESMVLVDRSVNRVAALVKSFKQLAIKNTDEHQQLFDLKDAIDNVIIFVSHHFKRRDIEIINAIPSGILCDSYVSSLEEIINNLVTNALVHAFEGAQNGTITVSAVCDQNQVTISVTDNGAGISSATLERIFDPFFTTKLGKGGSGLGLTVSKRIANFILEGDLVASSEIGKGTCFILTLRQKVAGKF